VWSWGKRAWREVRAQPAVRPEEAREAPAVDGAHRHEARLAGGARVALPLRRGAAAVGRVRREDHPEARLRTEA